MTFGNRLHTIEAQFAGQCPECLGWIKEGAQIRRSGDGWAHAVCPEEKKDVHPTCQKCWLVHPEGECP